MDNAIERRDALIRSAARRLTGHQRRLFQAEVATELCGGNARRAERRFGWGRDTVDKGMHELRQGIRCVENFAARGRPRWEEEDPQRMRATCVQCWGSQFRLLVTIRPFLNPRTSYSSISRLSVRRNGCD